MFVMPADELLKGVARIAAWSHPKIMKSGAQGVPQSIKNEAWGTLAAFGEPIGSRTHKIITVIICFDLLCATGVIWGDHHWTPKGTPFLLRSI